MCGRYSLVDPERLKRTFGRRFRFDEMSDTRLPRFNIAPTQEVLGVRDVGGDVVESLAWGIDGRINARAETIAPAVQGQRAIASAFQGRRCIVFADGFYEWRNKRPVYFQLDGGEPFAFAGIWALGERAAECAIVTTQPNALVRVVHDRMPVILSAAALDVWLGPGELSADVVRGLLVPYPADAMVSRPVSSRLNNARYDAADVLVDNDPVQPSLGL